MDDLSSRSGCLGWLRFFTGTEPNPGSPSQNQAPSGLTASQEALLQELDRLSEGLLFPSESDFPLESFFWNIGTSGQLSEAEVLNQLELPLGTPLEETNLERLFRNVTQIREGDDESQIRETQRFGQIRDFFLEHLLHPQVFRLGEIEIDVYAFGETREGGYLGFTTTLIET